jgi:hypothetical protein
LSQEQFFDEPTHVPAVTVSEVVRSWRVIRLHQTIPAMPVRNSAAAVTFYRDRLGFEVLHHDGGFAILARDQAVVHLTAT